MCEDLVRERDDEVERVDGVHSAQERSADGEFLKQSWRGGEDEGIG